MKAFSLYLRTALLALLAALGALLLSGVTPFGEATLCWQDNGQQVASDFGYLRGVWGGRHSLDWSFACGGSPRSAIHPTFNNLCSPLTWAVAALPGISAVTGLTLLFLLQISLLPLGALYYLRRSFPQLPAPLGMALALAYAFGGFMLTKYSFLPFLNVALLFPWYVAALDSLLRRGRWIPYTLLLAFMLAVGTYFAYMWLLFAAVYAAARTGWRWVSPVRQHTHTLILASAGALLLSAFSWLPSLLITAGSARAGESHLLWNLTRPGVEPEFWSYAALLPPALWALLMFRRRWGGNRYALTLMVLLVGLAFSSATTLWHVSRPWDFAGRFGYMASFMLICLLARDACLQRRRPLRWNPLAVGAGLCLAFWCSSILIRGMGEAVSLALPGTLVLALCWKWRLYHTGLLLTALVCSLSFSLALERHAWTARVTYQADAHRIWLAEWAARQLPQPEGRVKSRGNAAVENLAFFTPFDSLSHFTACITRAQEETPARWGYQQRSAVISDEGGTLATDTLLGMRYVLTLGSEASPALRTLAEQGDYRVEENPYWFGMGLMMPPGVLPLLADAADPIACQQALLGRLLGEEHAGTRSTGRSGEAPELPPGCLHYLQQPADESEEAFIYPGHPHERWGEVETISPLMPLPEGRVVERVAGAPAPFPLYHLPLTSLKALKRYALQLPVCCEDEGARMRISCRSTAERSLLFLPLLWQAGYSATVDGAPAAVQNLDGWVGLAMPQPGEHHVELVYRAPGRLAGMVTSAAALPLLLLAGLFTRRRPALAPSGALNTLCRRLLLGLSWLLLLWPGCVLPLGLLWC